MVIAVGKVRGGWILDTFLDESLQHLLTKRCRSPEKSRMTPKFWAGATGRMTLPLNEIESLQEK